MDKIKAMQTALAIAETGSLTAASEALNVSLPAVVRTLAILERYLGVRLFNRTTRRVTITEEGKIYVANCRSLLAAIDEAEAALTQDLVEPSGLLVVTAPVLFGQMYVAPAVTRFAQRHEKMRVSLMLHDRVVNLLDENVDVGIRIGHLDDQSLVAQSLGQVQRVVVASPEYLRKHGTPQHPRDLRKMNCIRFSGNAAPWWAFREKGKQFTVPVSGNLEFNQVWPTVQACLSGAGIGMFISYQVNDFIRQGQLKVVLAEFKTDAYPINLVYPHARLLPARTRAFIESMKQELRFGE
ncbi:MAG TPA: LysR family transcriptional regulator [Rhodocyclaceae bacterium]|jgi:DNA-binding transcriptional LysR family regulator|nr:LysR family transcriptional regulator [Rhodocyclaceae bacterium]